MARAFDTIDFAFKGDEFVFKREEHPRPCWIWPDSQNLLGDAAALWRFGRTPCGCVAGSARVGGL